MCAAADMWNYFFPAIMAVGMSCLGFFVRADAMPCAPPHSTARVTPAPQPRLSRACPPAAPWIKALAR